VHEIIRPLLDMDVRGKLAFTRMTGELVVAMRHCPQPLIAAVDGVCVGAGAVVAAACDLRLGTPRARVAFLFNRVGLAGSDMGACALLPRIVGLGRAAELLYTGREMSGEEAERWGFFNRLVAPEALLEEARALARQLASGPTFAHAMTKRMLHKEWDMSLDEAVESEAQAQALCMLTRDFGRGYEAFAQRRPPEFRGD
jgi:enoyl-CoA hydratase/carnithine racemase